MASILSLQTTIFSLILIDFLIRRIGLVTAEGQKCLTNIVIYLILPCNILDAFTKVVNREGLSAYLSIFLIALGIQILSLLYGKLIYRKKPDGRRKCLEYGTICNNAGFIGNPIVEGLYGSEGLVLASVYLIPLRIIMWSSGLSIFSDRHDRKTTFRRVVTHPCILACALGILLMLSGLSLPLAITEPLRTIGRCNTAMSMLVIGMILERIDLRQFWDKDVMIYCLHRLIVLPFLVCLLCGLLPVDHTVLGISVLLTAMPSGATTSILAEKY